MQDETLPEIHVRRLAFIREEMRFEVGVLHDRVNALISAEAFLLISFTMALTYSNGQVTGKFYFVAPVLALIGFLLAVLARPAVKTSFNIIVEWNVMLVKVINEAHAVSNFMWRPSSFTIDDRRTHTEHRTSLLFARSVPIVFTVAWAILAGIVLTAPWR